MIDKFEKADDKTIVLTTQYPFSFLPYLLTRILIASPTQWEKVGKNWAAFAKKPSGTGPFKITKVVLGQYAEMARNEDYWDKDAHPETRQDGGLPDAGSHHARRRVALRPGGLDRGAAARFHPLAEGRPASRSACGRIRIPIPMR